MWYGKMRVVWFIQTKCEAQSSLCNETPCSVYSIYEVLTHNMQITHLGY